jgi:GxxExxY protein
MQENEIETLIVDSAVHGHQDLGPGLWATVYDVSLAAKLRKREWSVERQVAIPMEYEGQRLEEGFRADLIVAGKVIVGRKSVEKVHPAPKKPWLTCLRLTGMKLGCLLDFGEALRQDGMTRIVHGKLGSLLRGSVPPGGREERANKRLPWSGGTGRVRTESQLPPPTEP